MPLHLDDDCFCYPRDRRVHHETGLIKHIPLMMQINVNSPVVVKAAASLPWIHTVPAFVHPILLNGVVPSLLDPGASRLRATICLLVIIESQLCLML